MKIYYVKMFIFIFLISTLVSPYYENFVNNHYNISLIQNNTHRTPLKSRLLAQTKNHNPHYHNDPELKEIIDKMNEEAIKKYQQTHDPYEQLKELVEKNGTKLTGGHGTESMSTTEKDLFEMYEEMFGEENHFMLKSGRYPNDDDGSDKSSTCECTDTNNTKLARSKGKDKYLKHLKHRCTRGICVCSVASAFVTMIGLALAKKAAVDAILPVYGEAIKNCVSSSSLLYIFDTSSLTSAIKAASATCVAGAGDAAGSAAAAATTAIIPYSIAIYVLIAITVLLIILYIWLYRRRKRSLKHECKKHLCK